MEEIIKQAKLRNLPIVRPKTLEMLLNCIKENNPKEILEVGTCIGYSAVNMLLNSDANLTSIELYEPNIVMAKQNLNRLGLIDRADLRLGDAKVILKDLVTENKKFDLIFLDGPKGQYLNYLPGLTALLNKGGIIFADDVLFRGLVLGKEWVEHSYRTIVVNLRKYLQEVKKPPYSSEIFDIEDGVCISKKVD